MSKQKIQPKLDVFDLTMIIVSLVIGIGIFRTPTLVAQAAGKPQLFFMAWIIGGLVSLAGALTYAEIGSRYPVPGGFYKIFSHCYHPAYAFMINWIIVLTYAAGAVGVTIIGVEYIMPVLYPEEYRNPVSVKISVIVITMVLGTLNYLGIKTGSRTQNILSVIKIMMIIGLAFTIFRPGAIDSAPELNLNRDSSLLTAVGVSLIAVFYTYGGYHQSMNFGGDIKDPQRGLPRAIFFGILIIMTLYLLINYAYYHVLGFSMLTKTDLVAAAMAEAFFGPLGSSVVSFVIFLSVLGFVNANIMSNPRIYFAMAEDRILPPVFMQVNTRTQVQEVALGFFLAIMLLSIFLLGTFEKIVNYVMVIDSIALATGAGCIFILRYRDHKDSHKGFKIRGYPLIPIIYIIFLLIVSVNVFISDPESALIGVFLFLLGFPVYVLLKRFIPHLN